MRIWRWGNIFILMQFAVNVVSMQIFVLLTIFLFTRNSSTATILHLRFCVFVRNEKLFRYPRLHKKVGEVVERLCHRGASTYLVTPVILGKGNQGVGGRGGGWINGGQRSENPEELRRHMWTLPKEIEINFFKCSNCHGNLLPFRLLNKVIEMNDNVTWTSKAW